MARLLPTASLPTQKLLRFLPAPAAFVVVFAAFLSVFSAVTFLCASHRGMMKPLSGRGDKSKTVRLGGEKKGAIQKMRSNLSSKALLMGKMISWRKVQDEEIRADEEEFGYEDEDGVVWKKTIIKGEKCRPIDFSGKILYDNDGNLLAD